MNKQQYFFKLLRHSNELRKNKESLSKKDPEIFNVLVEFLATIEDNFQYLEKQEYIQLANYFLADEITADDFSSGFMAIYQGISQKVAQMKREESLELVHFLKPNRCELGYLLARIYGDCDSFNIDPEVEIATTTEEELKECAKSLLFELREEEKRGSNHKE